MNNLGSSYNSALHAQSQTNAMFTLAMIAILVVFILTIRIVVGYFVAKRGNMIIEAKGYHPSEYSVNGMACYLSIFFGTIIAYIFVLWFSSALPVKYDKKDTSYENEETE